MRLTYRKLVRKRTDALLILFGVALLALAGRLVDLQASRASRYADIAKRIRSSKIPIAAQRGLILDRRGRILASNITACSIYAHPRQVQSRRRAALTISEAMGQGVNCHMDRLNSSENFVWLARNVNSNIGTAVQEAIKYYDLSGVGVQLQTRRTYPEGQTAAHAIGFTDIDGKGLEGIESAADSLLRGRDGYVVAELDANRCVIPQTRGERADPIDGHDIVLTIDANIQHIAEEELAKSVKASSAAGGSALVINPQTGEILALANYPTFDPNDRSTFRADYRRNRAVTDMYEPGSTLKIVTAAAALEEEAIKPGRTFNCPGYLQVGKRKIKCVAHGQYRHGHGAVDLPKIIRVSCNVGAAQVGQVLGAEKLYKYEKKFGFGRRPGSGATGESPGFVARPETWSQVQLANVAFGQGIAVTPMQMACAYAVIAAGGAYHQPRLIKEIRSKDGRVLRRYPTKSEAKGRRIVSTETAKAVARMMTAVIEDGTGEAAKIEGVSVAGKTGTAQKAPYGSGKYVGSFGGFLPADNPKLLIFVTIDEPKGSHYGGVIAAPVFREIARRVIWYMRIPREMPDRLQSARTAEAAGKWQAPAEFGHGRRLGPAQVRREGKLGRVSSPYSLPAPT